MALHKVPVRKDPANIIPLRKSPARAGFHLPSGRAHRPLSAAILAWFALQSLDAFLSNNGGHSEGCHRIGPPQAKKRVEQQSSQEYRRKISTKLRLFRVRVHGSAA